MSSKKKTTKPIATNKTERDTTSLAGFFPASAGKKSTIPMIGGRGKKQRMSKTAARAEGAAKVKAANATRPKAAKPAKEKRLSGLDLAAKVLASAKESLAAKTIAERTIAAGWKTSGKTPHATLYAAIIREIAAKGKDARFKKTDRGLFIANAGAK